MDNQASSFNLFHRFNMQTYTLILIVATIVPIIMSAPAVQPGHQSAEDVNGPRIKATIDYLRDQQEKHNLSNDQKIMKINNVLKDVTRKLEDLTTKKANCADYVQQALALAKMFVGQGLSLRKYTSTEEYPCNQEPCYSPTQVQATPDHFLQSFKN